MWSLIPLVAVPLVVLVLAKVLVGNAFTVKEFLALEALVLPVLVVGFLVARSAAMTDYELWNGHLTKKSSGTQKCCHCHQECTAHDKKGNCTSHHEVCQHSRDNWWSLSVSTGDEVMVEDCSTSWSAPRAWDSAVVGEPASVEHAFTNYLLADPESVELQVALGEGKAPSYPRVHDFYRADRALEVGKTAMDRPAWNAALSELNDRLGAKKHVNVVVVATTRPDPAFASVVAHDWLYGKLNDAVFVLGAPDGDQIEWAEVVALPTGNNELKVSASDLIGSKLSDLATVEKIEALVEAHWTWSGMDQLSYLGYAAKPSTLSLVLLYAMAIGLSVGGAVVAAKNDLFGEEVLRFGGRGSRRYGRG